MSKAICDNIYKFISHELHICRDEEIFVKVSFCDLGEFYYNKVLCSVVDATEELLKSVIRVMASRTVVIEEQSDYYIALCQILSVKKLPSIILSYVSKEFDEIFSRKYDEVVTKCNTANASINSQLQILKDKIDAIKNASPSHSLKRDLTADELNLYSYSYQCNLLRTQKEMIAFAVQ